MEKTLKKCYIGYLNSQEASKGVRYDKHSSDDLDDQQMEGQDHQKEII